MKKLLEVLQYGETDIRFNTDIDVEKNPDQLMTITSSLLFAMVTKLWGGNERSVIAIIRALAIADLAASINPDDMLKQLKDSALVMREIFEKAKVELEKNGGKVMVFGPGISPSQTKC